MEKKQITATLFLLALAAVALCFCYIIARPFLKPVSFAVIIAVIFHPAHGRIQARIRGRNLAAFLSTILVVVFVGASVLVLGILVSQEITNLYAFGASGTRDGEF